MSIGTSGDGFILLHRRLMDSFAFANPYHLKLWIYCLLKASYTKRWVYVGTATVELAPGQFVWGRAEASARLNSGLALEAKTGRTWDNYLKQLEKQGMITCEANRRFTLVTIVNYMYYQREFAITGGTGMPSGGSALRPVGERGAERGRQGEAPVFSHAGEQVACSRGLPAENSAGNIAPADAGAWQKNGGKPQEETDAWQKNGGKLQEDTRTWQKTREKPQEDASLAMPGPQDTDAGNPYKMFSRAFSRPMTEVIAQSIAEWTNDFGGQSEIVAFAIEEAGKNAAQNPKYFSTILKAWQKQGVTTLAEAKQKVSDYEAEKERRLEEKLQHQEEEKQLAMQKKDLPKVSLYNWLEGRNRKCGK